MSLLLSYDNLQNIIQPKIDYNVISSFTNINSVTDKPIKNSIKPNNKSKTKLLTKLKKNFTKLINKQTIKSNDESKITKLPNKQTIKSNNISKTTKNFTKLPNKQTIKSNNISKTTKNFTKLINKQTIKSNDESKITKLINKQTIKSNDESKTTKLPNKQTIKSNDESKITKLINKQTIKSNDEYKTIKLINKQTIKSNDESKATKNFTKLINKQTIKSDAKLINVDLKSETTRSSHLGDIDSGRNIEYTNLNVSNEEINITAGNYKLLIPDGGIPQNFRIKISNTFIATSFTTNKITPLTQQNIINITANKTVLFKNLTNYIGLVSNNIEGEDITLNFNDINIEINNSTLSFTANNNDIEPFNSYNGWLFIGGATNNNLKALSFNNCSIKYDLNKTNYVESSFATCAIGGLCGGYLTCNDVSFNNCSFNGNIIASSLGPIYSIGGLCGGFLQNSKTIFYKCSFNGNIKSEGQSMASIGGICGGFNNCTGNPKNINEYGLQFDGCNFSGDIISNGNQMLNYHANGGICGGFNNYLPGHNINFINCSSKKGNINSLNSVSANGGICGGFNCSILDLVGSNSNPNNSTMLFLNCSNTNPINGIDSFNGGICGGGNINGKYKIVNQVAIGSVFFINCITVGDIMTTMVNGETTTDPKEFNNASNGGISGGFNMCNNISGSNLTPSYFKIINCQFIGTIDGKKTCNGGILGGSNFRNNFYNCPYYLEINNCSNRCRIINTDIINDSKLDDNSFIGGICGGKNSIFKGIILNQENTINNNFNINNSSVILLSESYDKNSFNSGIVPLTIIKEPILNPIVINIKNCYINWDIYSPRTSQYYINFPSLSWDDTSYISTDLNNYNSLAAGQINNSSKETYIASPYSYTECNQIAGSLNLDYKLLYSYNNDAINTILTSTLTDNITLANENNNIIWYDYKYFLSSYYKNNIPNSYNLSNAIEVLKSISITKSIKKFFVNVLDLLSGDYSTSYTRFIDYYYKQSLSEISTVDNFFTILNNYFNAGSTEIKTLLNLVLSVTSDTLSSIKNKLKKAYVKVMPNNAELFESRSKSIIPYIDSSSIEEGQDDLYIQALLKLFEKNKIKTQQKENFIEVVETPASIDLINIVKNIEDIFSKYSNRKKVYEFYKDKIINKNIRSLYKIYYNKRQEYVRSDIITEPIRYNKISAKCLMPYIKNIITAGLFNIKSLYSYKKATVSDIIQTIQEIIKPHVGLFNIKSLYSYKKATVSDIIQTIQEIIKPHVGLFNIKSLHSYKKATVSDIIQTIQEIIKPHVGLFNIKSLHSYKKATISYIIQTIQEIIKPHVGLFNIKSLYNRPIVYSKPIVYIEPIINIEPIFIRNNFNYSKLYCAYKYSYAYPTNPYKYVAPIEYKPKNYKYLSRRYIINKKDIIIEEVPKEQLLEKPKVLESIIIIMKPKIIIDKPNRIINKDIKHKNIKTETKITKILRK